MNKEALLATADHIEKNPASYDQSDWCGTTCCIAGHAVMQDKKLDVLKMDEFDVSMEARAFLGLNYMESTVLFGALGQHWPEPYREDFRVLSDILNDLEDRYDCAYDAVYESGVDTDDDVVEELKQLTESHHLRKQAIRRIQSYIAVRMLRAIAAGEVTLVSPEEDGEVERG